MYSSAAAGSTIRRVSEDTPAEPGALASGLGPPGVPDADARREALKQVFLDARGCVKCAQLAAARTQVVFGAGHADATLMLIGEAPTAREDEQGVPFTGAAGKLLDDLLGSIGLARADVFITHVLKCRPPGNRDADPSELAKCRPYLLEQVKLVQPRVVCTLGNFATRALTGDGAPVTERHGQAEIVELGETAVHLVPLFHPAAALYTRSLLDTLREDFARLPELLARPALPQPVIEPAAVDEPEEIEESVAGDDARPAATDELQDEAGETPDEPPESQLGLF